MRSLCKRLWLNSLRAVRHQPVKASRPLRFVVEELESRLVPSGNYFISPSGNDTRDGLSPQTAWRTINRVNQQQYGPGDTINFEGGSMYNGNLAFGDPTGGTADNPVTLTSYNGRATIYGGLSYGVALGNVSGFRITDLAIAGTTNGRDANDGISIACWGGVSSHIYIDNVEVYGFAQGIEVYAATNASIQDLEITYTTIHDLSGPGNPILGTAGIVVYGDTSSQRSIAGLYIGHVQVYNNENQFGIFVANLEGGVVERSEVHDIGGPRTRNGIGIVSWDSDAVTFQYNEVYDIIDPTGIDGDGLFFGDGVTNSVMQYNYAHDNTSFGLELVSDLPGGAANVGNTVRYNISENNHAGIVVAGAVWYAEVYNNTVYCQAGGAVALNVYSWTGTGLAVWNNILETTSYPGNCSFWTNMRVAQTISQGLVLQGNAYYQTGGTFRVYYSDAAFSDLSQWQNATGEELLSDGTPVGYVGDPGLVAAGQGGTIGDPDLLFTLSAYNLQVTSPVGYTGLDLAGLFGVDPGAQDFYGTPLNLGLGFSVGAYQVPGLDVSGGQLLSVRLAPQLGTVLSAIDRVDLPIDPEPLSGVLAPAVASPHGDAEETGSTKVPVPGFAPSGSSPLRGGAGNRGAGRGDTTDVRFDLVVDNL